MKCDKPEPEDYWTDELKVCHFTCLNCGKEVVETDKGWVHGHFETKLIEDI